MAKTLALAIDVWFLLCAHSMAGMAQQSSSCGAQCPRRP
jgi:hypothetical protein